MNVYELTDKITYGALSDPGLMRVSATFLNFAMTYFFYLRACEHGGNPGPYMAVVAAMTVVLYAYFDGACGISTIWCFSYGMVRRKTALDHAVFFFACASVVVPYYLCRWYPWLWPFGEDFLLLLNLAHVGFASLGLLRVPYR